MFAQGGVDAMVAAFAQAFKGFPVGGQGGRFRSEELLGCSCGGFQPLFKWCCEMRVEVRQGIGEEGAYVGEGTGSIVGAVGVVEDESRYPCEYRCRDVRVRFVAMRARLHDWSWDREEGS